MSQLTPYNLRKRERRNYKNINNGSESLSLEGDTVSNSPKHCLNSIHNSLDSSGSEAVDNVDQTEVRNVSALPFEGAVDNEMIHVETNVSDTDGFTNSETEQNIDVGDEYTFDITHDDPAHEEQDISTIDTEPVYDRIIGQELKDPPLQRPKSSTLRKIRNFPAQNLTFDKAVHDPSLRSDQFYYHTESADSGSDQSKDSSEENLDGTDASKMEYLEMYFRKKHGINFKDYTINPCKIPNEDAESKKLIVDKENSQKFGRWLQSSPFGVWVTKFGCDDPFAQCKYKHCNKRFPFNSNPTSSNIVKHFKTNHKADYTKFYAKVYPKQKELSNFKNVISANQKPFQLCNDLLDFFNSFKTPIKQLNYIVDHLLPFSMVESESFLELTAGTGEKGNRSYTYSRKTLVKLMDKYYEQFEQQMRLALSRTSNINVLLDIWTSASGKSYLAILVSFCPNLEMLDRYSTKRDVLTKTFPNTHVIGFHDVSGSRHTGDYLKDVVVGTLEKYSIEHKVGSITVDNASNNSTMLSKIDDDLSGDGVNELGGTVKIRCMNHVLNIIFKSIVEKFELQNQDLVSRIDSLTIKIKHNVFLREQFRKYAAKTIPKNNETRFVSRYRQFFAFLSLTNDFQHFYLYNRVDKRFQLKREDSRLFLYEVKEIKPLKLFLKLTRLFFELTMALQDDSWNMLPFGIQYYGQLKHFFESCASIAGGNFTVSDLSNAGIKLDHLDQMDEESKLKTLSTITQATPLFDKYIEAAYSQTGYWVAHMLRPDMKDRYLGNILNPDLKNTILKKVSSYVNFYLNCRKPGESVTVSYGDRIPMQSKQRVTSQKKYRVLKNYHKSFLTPQRRPGDETSLEWNAFLSDKTDSSFDFVDYWLKNRERFPKLSILALSYYHVKLSTADVERCFSISKRAVEGRYSLSSENLKRTIILRNRLKCFGFREKLTRVTSLADPKWEEEEIEDLYDVTQMNDDATDLDNDSDDA